MPDKQAGEMPEGTSQVDGEVEAGGEVPAGEAFDQERAMATIRKLREEIKELRKLTKDIDALKLQQGQAEEARMAQEKRWQELAEKRATELADLKRELSVSEIRRLRIQVTATKGLNPQLAERLQGTTLEEIEADADMLLTLFPKSTEPEPKPEVKPGAPNIDATGLALKKPGTSVVAKLTTEELEVAKQLGLSPEAYAKWKS